MYRVGVSVFPFLLSIPSKRKARIWQIQAAACELRTHVWQVIHLWERHFYIICSWDQIQNCITTTISIEDNCNFCTAIKVSGNNAGFVHTFELCVMSTQYVYYNIAYQEHCFQEYSCKKSIDVTWISWKAQKLIIAICIVSYPLCEDPHLNQEISKETQHYHCDDESLNFTVKVNIYRTEVIKHKVIFLHNVLEIIIVLH